MLKITSILPIFFKNIKIGWKYELSKKRARQEYYVYIIYNSHMLYKYIIYNTYTLYIMICIIYI